MIKREEGNKHNIILDTSTDHMGCIGGQNWSNDEKKESKVKI